MANKNLKVLSNLSSQELQAKVAELEGKLFESRMKKSVGQLEKVSDLWKFRKELARVRTLLTSKDAGGVK